MWIEKDGLLSIPLNQILQKNLEAQQTDRAASIYRVQVPHFTSKIYPGYAYKKPKDMRSSTVARYHQIETAAKYRKI